MLSHISLCHHAEKAYCQMPSSLTSLPPLAHCLPETAVWSESLEWNLFFSWQSWGCDFSGTAQSHAQMGAGLFHNLHSQWRGKMASHSMLPLHHLIGLSFPKRYKEHLPHKAEYALNCSAKQMFHVAPFSSVQPTMFEFWLFVSLCVRQERYKTEMVSLVWSLNSSDKEQVHTQAVMAAMCFVKKKTQ